MYILQFKYTWPFLTQLAMIRSYDLYLTFIQKKIKFSALGCFLFVPKCTKQVYFNLFLCAKCTKQVYLILFQCVLIPEHFELQKACTFGAFVIINSGTDHNILNYRKIVHFDTFLIIVYSTDQNIINSWKLWLKILVQIGTF